MATSLIENPVIDRHVREEIAKEIWRLFQILGGKQVVTFDTHAIQIIIFPRQDETFRVTGHTPVLGTIRNNEPYKE